MPVRHLSRGQHIMPEISDAELRQFVRYQNLGTPEEIQKRITDLEKDNHKYRQEEKPALEAKIPKEGEVVVPKADADLIPAIKELGKPEEIKAKIEEGEQARNKLADVERRSAASKFAKAAGLADEAVDTLVAIPALQGASFEIRKGKVKDAKGQEVEADVAYVTMPGENQKPLTFTEAQEQVPALKGLRTAEPTTSRPATGVPFVPQSGGGDNKPGNRFDRIREERAAAKKPAVEAPKKPSVFERLGMARAE